MSAGVLVTDGVVVFVFVCVRVGVGDGVGLLVCVLVAVRVDVEGGTVVAVRVYVVSGADVRVGVALAVAFTSPVGVLVGEGVITVSSVKPTAMSGRYTWLPALRMCSPAGGSGAGTRALPVSGAPEARVSAAVRERPTQMTPRTIPHCRRR